MVNDDLVGSGTIKLDEIFMKGALTQWYPIMYKGDKAGSLNIEL